MIKTRTKHLHMTLGFLPFLKLTNALALNFPSISQKKNTAIDKPLLPSGGFTEALQVVSTICIWVSGLHFNCFPSKLEPFFQVLVRQQKCISIIQCNTGGNASWSWNNLNICPESCWFNLLSANWATKATLIQQYIHAGLWLSCTMHTVYLGIVLFLTGKFAKIIFQLIGQCAPVSVSSV